jgi:hypothetical protein
MNLVNSPRNSFLCNFASSPSPDIHDDSALLFPSRCQGVYYDFTKTILAGIIGRGSKRLRGWLLPLPGCASRLGPRDRLFPPLLEMWFLAVYWAVKAEQPGWYLSYATW